MFRGIDINTGEWVHGYYVKRLVVFPNKATAYQYGIVAHGNNVKYPPVESREYPVHPDSIAQNTGKKDKYFENIYGSIFIEGRMSKGGDVLEIAKSEIVSVQWNQQVAGFDTEPEISFCDWGWNETCADHLGRVKIIGTQWEGVK